MFFNLRFSKNVVSNLNNDKIPKFKKAYINPFNERWSKKDEGKVVNLQTRGFLRVVCSTNRKITKFFTKNELEDVKKSLC